MLKTPTLGADSASTAITHGMAMMICAMLLLPGIDAVAKLLSGSISAGQSAWARFLFQTLLLLPIVAWHGRFRVKGHLWAHAARGILLAGATLCFFAAIKVMPLADAIAVFFVQPFIVAILAALLLAETFGWRRLLAIAIGFGGALLIVKPSYEVFGLTALLPVGTALSFALYVILTRWLARDESAFVMQFVAGLFGLAAMSIALVAGHIGDIDGLRAVWPTLDEWAMLAMLGVIGTTGHILVVMAYNRAPVAILAPFQYLEIISATALGFVLFGNLPDALTWLGITIIVASGLFVFYREYRLSAA